MPLLDHFSPPLSNRRNWRPFQSAWATLIAADLNTMLPPDYVAEPNVQFGFNVDVVAAENPDSNNVGLGPEWKPPAPVRSISLCLAAEAVEVLIYLTEGGMVLEAAIEIISPTNKSPEEHRNIFASNCETMLREGHSLVLVDAVTSRTPSLDNELMARFATSAPSYCQSQLYATSYRPIRRGERNCLDIWQEGLIVGLSLPTVPLWLRGCQYLPLNLEASYERTCRELRVSPNGV